VTGRICCDVGGVLSADLKFARKPLTYDHPPSFAYVSAQYRGMPGLRVPPGSLSVYPSGTSWDGRVTMSVIVGQQLHVKLGADGGVTIEGYEMLKGLQGVPTHEHSEWLPIVENSQDMTALAETVGQTLNEHKAAHGFLVRRHGLYTWGETVAQAKRHIEIFEFLLETMGRTLHIRK